MSLNDFGSKVVSGGLDCTGLYGSGRYRDGCPRAV